MRPFIAPSGEVFSTSDVALIGDRVWPEELDPETLEWIAPPHPAHFRAFYHDRFDARFALGLPSERGSLGTDVLEAQFARSKPRAELLADETIRRMERDFYGAFPSLEGLEPNHRPDLELGTAVDRPRLAGGEDPRVANVSSDRATPAAAEHVVSRTD